MERVEQGTVPITQLSRLSDVLANSDGDVSYTLNFSFNSKRRASAVGTVSGGLALSCQRCMNTYIHTVETDVAVQFVPEEQQTQEIADGYEPVLADEDGVRLSDIIEEELILAVPLIPMCTEGDGQCGDIAAVNAENDRQYLAVDEDQPQARKPSPFDILKDD